MYFYVVLNGFLYLALGIWCAVSPHRTSQSVGILPQGQQGMAEFIAVYGGLEVGLGIFLLCGALKASLIVPGFLLLFLIYAGLSTFRLFSILTHGGDLQNGWNFFYFETLMFLLGIALVIKNRQVIF